MQNGLKECVKSALLFLVMILVSCDCSKKNSSTTVSHSDGIAITPSTFRCEGLVNKISEEDSSGCIYYSLIISNVSARGSSLIYQPGKGDTLLLKDCDSSPKKNFILKNDFVRASIEERLQLNQQLPEFILRTIDKQKKH